MTREERIRNRRITILGMARSGMAVARLIKAQGGIPFVSDSAATEKLSRQISELQSLGIDFETGAHSDRALSCDFAVLSPGISPRSPFAEKLRAKGAPLFSELEVSSWALSGKMIAITGANGKTTTTHMVYDICRAAGLETWICGNVGTPLAAYAQEIPPTGVAVVEVSSYQLELIEEMRPDIAVIINLTPDHLERHGDMARYRDAKLRITENQLPTDTLVLNSASPALEALNISTRANRLFFGPEESLTQFQIPTSARGVFQRGKSLCAFVEDRLTTLLNVDDLHVPGAHNVENAMAAATACLAFGVNAESIKAALRAFAGVEHRIEFVRELNGVRFVNDSKATNLDATARALEAMSGPTLLIIGGRGKNEDFRTLRRLVQDRVRNIVAIGETREEIFGALGKTAPVEFADTLSEAVNKLARNARTGETVLLSPGCASFDMFTDFEHRGREFKAAVHSLSERVSRHAQEVRQ